MASHRNISPSYAEAVARLSSSAAKSVKKDKTASKGTVSRLRYETEKRSLTGYATETYVDEGDASTLESAEAYADEAASDALTSAQAADAETLSSAESYTDAVVAEAVAGVYTVCGSCAYADLPEDAEVGDVWNVTDGFELDGETYDAGTNLVKTDDGWDALAGITDLSAYATTAYVDEAVDEAVAGVETDAAPTLLGSTVLDADVEAGDDMAETLSVDIDAPGGTVLATLTGAAWLTATDEACLPIAGHALAELDIDGEAVAEAAIAATMSTAARSVPLLSMPIDVDEGAHAIALLMQSSGDEYSTFTLGAGAGLAVYAIG